MKAVAVDIKVVPKAVAADIKAAIPDVKAVVDIRAAVAVDTKVVRKAAVGITVMKPDRIPVDGHPSIANPQLGATIGIARLTAMLAQTVNSAKVVVAIGITEAATTNLKVVTTNLKAAASLAVETMAKVERLLTKKKSIATKAVA